VTASYIHANDKVGAMVEVQCETDFVARNEEFKVFAYQVALHAAATAPQFVSTEEIPEEEREAEKRVFEEKAKEEGKPDNVVEKIVQGQLDKWAGEVALLDQTHVNTEKHDSKTIEELRQELAAKTGENIRVARLAYFRVGE
jgi:elongation factor Ts